MGSSLVSMMAGGGGAFEARDVVSRTLRDTRGREEVEHVLARAKTRASASVAANRHILHALRDALLERDELLGDEIYDVARAAGAPVRDIVLDRRGTDRRREDHLTRDGADHG